MYTDGSDIDGGVGAAAAIYVPGRSRVKMLHFHLGPSTRHTVYEAELVGLLLGIELLRQESTKSVYIQQAASIAVDNQSTVQASTGFSSQPGHYLLTELHKATRSLLKKHTRTTLTIRWVPGHKGVEGNEKVDEGAKKAAGGFSSPPHGLPGFLAGRTLPTSVSKIREGQAEGLKKKAAELWKESPRHEKLSQIDPGLPSKAFRKLTATLPRKQASILFQLRSGHIPLQSHLYRIKKVPSPTCAHCGNHEETVHHFLLACHSHRRARDILRKKVGRNAESLPFILSSATAMTPLFEYIHATGRLKDIYGDIRLKDSARPAGKKT